MSELSKIVLARLENGSVADTGWALVIVAALEGDAPLAACLDGTPPRPPAPPAQTGTKLTPHPDASGVFVSSISVSRFRGIGSTARLPLTAAPGLTLVVGRNGSGKSSFAEALECLFTGTSYRWEGRHAPWKTGWKNLHQAGDVAIAADLYVAGQGPLVVSRVWHGDALGDAETRVSAKGSKDKPFSSLGWDEKLATFRPFLSYNELGSLLDEGPSKLYDALSSVLGLDELTAVQTRLVNARRTREQMVTGAKASAKEIVQRIAAVESNDERFRKALLAFGAKTFDLAALAALIVADDAPEESLVSQLRRIGSLAAPDLESVQAIVGKLRTAERAFKKVAGTNAARARQRADLLESAIKFHDAQHSPDCPVCGSKGMLSPLWRAGAQEEVAALRDEAKSYDSADASRRAVINEAQRFISQPPPILAQAINTGLSCLPEARTQWATWGTAREIGTASALADHFESNILAFSEAVTNLATEARDEAQKRDDAWRPIASAIAEWLPAARKAQAAQASIADLKDAEKWWKQVSEEMRDERFAPIAKKAMDTWKQLRLQSNVDLGEIDLEGAGVRRKVALKVTVDGTPAEAVGVMSQGELHALALSLFLPRATLAESPFRFIAIDDPVQSMDPARIDGLARVLGAAAKTRQVIVFTHDDRLPESARRLGIPATVLNVTRREKSAVDVRETMDPVFGYIDDARALAKTTELPSSVIARVVPGFCRSAVEASCMEAVRVRRLRKGEQHDVIEALLMANSKMHPLMALALFDDEKKTNEVLARLNKFGKWAGDAFMACKEGAHEAHTGDLETLIDASYKLATQVRGLP
jgi:recombinational DNA repair ATPase RecF